MPAVEFGGGSSALRSRSDDSNTAAENTSARGDVIGPRGGGVGIVTPQDRNNTPADGATESRQFASRRRPKAHHASVLPDLRSDGSLTDGGRGVCSYCFRHNWFRRSVRPWPSFKSSIVRPSEGVRRGVSGGAGHLLNRRTQCQTVMAACMATPRAMAATALRASTTAQNQRAFYSPGWPWVVCSRSTNLPCTRRLVPVGAAGGRRASWRRGRTP